MAKTKLAITLDVATLAELDGLVRAQQFANRSQAIQEAVAEKLTRLSHGRLVRECANLDPVAEQALADEGLGAELAEWPAF
jgi:metal-responsive CopG/Arc/MetJ family transcriptional regulator